MSTIRQDIRELKTGRPELRKFGLLVGGVFLLLGIILLIRGRPAGPYFLVPGVLLVVFGLLAPGILKHVYIAWMSAAIALGFVVGTLVLTLFFFLVMTPVGLIARLAGKDFLRLKLDAQAKSYWIKREQKPPVPADYERQF